ncbi:MAG: 16S rRNA (guanine(527)-N(7))-methyltransferase RsmG [Crocinitomicaceae bacterium]|nr:16S rRNA (guanine(527)-N(7))-methyltransferase RsmG [Crocinitomicaceae bacterium]|tara:strand:- start:1491 stop:2108 length:618 start_codon:yes stop_codon:yes gene_type:complete
MNIIEHYFPDLSPTQKEQFAKLGPLYTSWNSKINVISRKDIDLLYERHVLHSLAIGKYISFNNGSKVLDVGTGGGFPGIPLAILFPNVRFTLIDSIGKKIKVVNDVARQLGLKNCQGLHMNAKLYTNKVDFVVSRAVTNFPDFLKLVEKNIRLENKNPKPNGIIYLKGGDLSKELSGFEDRIDIRPINDYFNEDFFNQKLIIHYY